MAFKVDFDSLKAAAETMARMLQPDAEQQGEIIVTLIVRPGYYAICLCPFGPIIEDSIQ